MHLGLRENFEADSKKVSTKFPLNSKNTFSQAYTNKTQVSTALHRYSNNEFQFQYISIESNNIVIKLNAKPPDTIDPKHRCIYCKFNIGPDFFHMKHSKKDVLY